MCAWYIFRSFVYCLPHMKLKYDEKNESYALIRNESYFVSLIDIYCKYFPDRLNHIDMHPAVIAYTKSKTDNEQENSRRKITQTTLPFVSTLDKNKVNK